MLGWLKTWLSHADPPSPWRVEIVDGAILTTDGRSPPRRLALADLRQVVVATDDSGPWGDDVVFLLHDASTDPVGVFPLEAQGAQAFAAWLETLPGYSDGEMVEAMRSTRVARFVVYQRPPVMA